MKTQYESQPELDSQSTMDAAISRSGRLGAAGVFLMASFILYIVQRDPRPGEGLAAASVHALIQLLISIAVISSLAVAYRRKKGSSLHLRHSVPLFIATAQACITALVVVSLAAIFANEGFIALF